MKKISIMFLTLVSCLALSYEVKVKADAYRFEKVLLDIGFKDVHEALLESETYYMRKIALPTQLPPVAFTHNFARFSNYHGEENEEFEMAYLHEEIPSNHYQIRVRPAKYKLEFDEAKIDQTIPLADGSEAIYTTKMPQDTLAFEKNDWQYLLIVDKRISDAVTRDVLVDIANSIQ